MKFLTAAFFFIMVFMMAIIPYFLMYLLSDLLAFLLCKVFKYRKQLILKNLNSVFSDKSEEQIKEILPKVYKNLTDNILEGIKAFSMLKRQIVRRHKIVDTGIIDDYYNQGKSIIAVTGHYNNWEWGSLSASLQTKYNVVGLYKPLSNKLIDNFIRKSRQKCGTILAPINDTSRTFEKYKDIPTVYLMAADQSPGKKYKKSAFWIDFLGRDTAFLHGPEKYAKSYNYPVVYVNVQRAKRGFYTVELSVLSDNPEQDKEGEITTMFAKKLESNIKQEPANWLWSHNRWKLKR